MIFRFEKIIFTFLLLQYLAFSSLLKIYFIDVYQGDSIFIIMPNKTTMLIDAGDKSKYYDCGKYVYNFIKKQKVNKINLIIATHPHRDHIGGLEYILSNIKVEKFYDPVIPYGSDIYKKILALIDKKKVSYYICREETEIKLDPEVEVKVLNPPKNYLFKLLNDNSVVLKIRYKDFSLLLTGDIEKKAEEDFIKRYWNNRELLKSEIIKVPHHGSKTSSTQIFLQLVSPKVAVFTCGKNKKSKIKFPEKEIVDRYKEIGAKIYRTCIDGTIEITTDGMDYKINKIKK